MTEVVGAAGFAALGLAAALFAERKRRRQAEAGQRASREEQRRLAGRLIEAAEQERRRVARELHDDFSQGLALLAVELDLLAGELPGPAGDRAARLRGVAGRVKELSSAVHHLSHRLHPAALERVGVVAAVRGLCEEIGRCHGVRVGFTYVAVPTDLPTATALCLYRVVQEALRNVVKHGGTDRAAVELTGMPGGVVLRVTDDGAGFDLASAGGGLGLVSMRERLHLAGGELTVDSRPDGGTRVEAYVPVPQARSPTGRMSASGGRHNRGVNDRPGLSRMRE